MRSKTYASITLAGAVVVLFLVLAVSVSSIFRDATLATSPTETPREPGLVGPPASVAGTLPSDPGDANDPTSPTTTLAEYPYRPLSNWPQGLKPLENYGVKSEYNVEDSNRWDLEIRGNINIITGALVTDMRENGWEVEVLFSYLGIEILGTYGESKMSVFVDTLLSDESNLSHMVVVYQKTPIPYQAPVVTTPAEANSKS